MTEEHKEKPSKGNLSYENSVFEQWNYWSKGEKIIWLCGLVVFVWLISKILGF